MDADGALISTTCGRYAARRPMRLTPCSSSRSIRLRCRPWRGVALNQVEAEPCRARGRSAALNRHLRDRGAVQPARELLLDDRAGADADLVDDDLARHDAEDELLAVRRAPPAPAGRRRLLSGRSGWSADRCGTAGWRGRAAAGTRRPPARRPAAPPCAAGGRVRAQAATAAAQTCRPAIRSVIACACVDSHGLSFSYADSQLGGAS